MPPRAAKRTRQSLTKENQSQKNSKDRATPSCSSISSNNTPAILSDPSGALKSIDQTFSHKFALLSLVEDVQRRDPSTSSDDDQTHHSTARRSSRSKRNSANTTSRKSDSNVTTTTPVSLINDLVHYRELYSRHKFTYLEQSTKEMFIERLMDEDEIKSVEKEDVERLEREVERDKGIVGSEKRKMVELIRGLEEVGGSVGRGYVEIGEKREVLESLPREIERLKREIEEERKKIRGGKGRDGEEEDAEGDDGDDVTEMNLPLDETFELVRMQEIELERVERELERYEKVEVPRRRRLLEGLGKEVKGLERDRKELVEFVDKVVKMREGERATGRADRENMGRWYKTVEEALEQLAV